MPNRSFFLYANINRLEVAWNIYSGRLFSASSFGEDNYRPMAFWPFNLVRLASKGDSEALIKLEKEIFIEKLRREVYPEKVSRIHGVYFWNSEENALLAQKWASTQGKHFDRKFLTTVEFHSSNESLYDTQWIDRHLIYNNEPLDERRDKEWMLQYLKGAPMNSTPHWELISEGKGTFHDKFILSQAKNYIDKFYPQLRAVAELSRLSKHLGSDFGLTYPFLQISNGGVLKGDFFISWSDLDNPEYEKKLANYIQSLPSTQVDMKWLRHGKDFVIPDLRSESFIFDSRNLRSSLAPSVALLTSKRSFT